MIDLNALGLYPVLLLAGFLGALVYIAAQSGPPKNWWEVFSPVAAAVPCANYLSHFAVGYFFGAAAATGTPGGMGAFLIGVGGPWWARVIIKKAKRWNPDGRSTST